MPLSAFLADTPSSVRRLAAAGLVALLAFMVVAVAANGQTSSGHYRTATATTSSVDQVLQSVATIEPVTQAAVAFPIAGTVESVDVAVGDRVAVGTSLATLETASLERTLRQQQAALDQAELTLERALNGEAVGTGIDPSGGSGAIPASYETEGEDSSAVVDLTDIQTIAAQSGPSDADIAAAQQALLGAQQQADAALAAVQPAIDNATSVCAAVGSADAAGFPAALTACTDAIAAVTTAQQAAQSSQAAVSSAAATLDDLLAQRAAALGEQPPPTTQPTQPSQPAPSTGGTGPELGSVPSTGSGGGGSSVSSERLIALQRAVDAAALEVIVAQQAVAQAAIASPIAGTVIAVNMTPGDEVDAASATANIIISGRGGYEATVNVSVDDLADLEVGQAATVRPDGSDEEIEGEVVAIGVAANAGSFPITIGLDGNTRRLGNGATATADITTSAAEDVLTVPTSAVAVDGETASVQVPDGDDTEAVTVEIGAVGATLTEITSGLEAGQEVVLADLDEPLPGSATDTSSTTLGPGGFNGGFPAGGGIAP
ncbi:MAG: HlyD family efflux transporter periplasmic adaptor subunit [Acidimicrobiales bacterium]